MASGTFRCSLHVALQCLTPVSCAYYFFRLISVLHALSILALKGQV